MNIELKQAAQRALLALRNSQPHPSSPFIGLTDKDFIDHEETIRQLHNALQQAEVQKPATGEPVAIGYINEMGELVKYPAPCIWMGQDCPRAKADRATHECYQRIYTRPAPSVLKDDQIAALVNKVRDIARMFHDHQSLRERIAIELVPALKVSQEAKSDAERGRLLIKWLKRYGLLQAEFGQIGAGEKPENWWLLYAPWGIDQTRPFLGHGKTPEQAIDAMLAAK